MRKTNWENTLEDLRHRLDLMQSRAHEDSVRFEELWKQAEYTKVQILAHQLEARRKHLARSRGVTSFAENKKGLPLALGIAAGASILVGMITKDWIASSAGSKAVLQGQGETEWIVCLEQNLAVAPRNNIRQKGIWVTWDSLKTALRELEELAKNGAHLGSLDNIISELKKSKKVFFVITLSRGGTTV